MQAEGWTRSLLPVLGIMVSSGVIYRLLIRWQPEYGQYLSKKHPERTGYKKRTAPAVYECQTVKPAKELYFQFRDKVLVMRATDVAGMATPSSMRE